MTSPRKHQHGATLHIGTAPIGSVADSGHLSHPSVDIASTRAIHRVPGLPSIDDAVDVVTDEFAGFLSRKATHEEIVVAGVLVTDRGDHGQPHRLGLQGATRAGTADPSTAAGAGVLGDE